MWFLLRKNDGKIVYLMEQEYTFGRSKDGKSKSHVTLAEDVSISRKHLKFMVKYSSTENFNEPILKVMDLGSTYGTYINPSNENSGKIEPNVWVDLKKGSLVQFGAQNNWVVKWHDIIVVCSALGNSERRKMTDTLSKLGGSVAVDWREDLTHLVIGVIKMTAKVIDALISAKPLVTCEYFEAWKDALSTNPEANAPDIKHFIPEIDPTPMLQRFDKIDYIPKESRKTLFHGKTFLFPTKSQYDSVARSIEKAGGKSTMDLQQEDEGNQIILIGASDASASTKEYLTCLNKVKDRGHRTISMKEILLALIAGSTLRYCNPSATGEVDQKTLFGPRVASLRSSSSLPERSLYVHDSEAIGEATSNTDSITDRGEPPSKKKRSDLIQETQSLFDATQLIQRDIPLTDTGNDSKVRDESESLLASTVKQSGSKLKRKQLDDLETPGPSSFNKTLPIRINDASNVPSVEMRPPDSKRPKLVEINSLPSIITKAVHPEKKILPSTSGRVGADNVKGNIRVNKDITLDQTVGFNESKFSRTTHARTFNDSTMKMMKVVHSFRPNVTLPSQNTQVKVKDITTRIRNMSVMVRKEGKWIKH